MDLKDLKLKKLSSLTRQRRNVWVVWAFDWDMFGVFSRKVTQGTNFTDMIEGLMSDGWCTPSMPNDNNRHKYYGCKLCPDCGIVSVDIMGKIGIWIHFLYTFGDPFFSSNTTVEGTVWRIPAALILPSLKLLEGDSKQFKEVLDAASSRKEFLALAAIS